MYFSLLGSPLPLLSTPDKVFFHLSSGDDLLLFFSIRFHKSIYWSLAQEMPEVCFATTEKLLERCCADHASVGWKKVFDILHSPSLYHGELIGVTVMDDTDSTHSRCTEWCSQSNDELCDRKWWMKCLSTAK